MLVPIALAVTPMRGQSDEDSVAIIFDRPDERQIVFERMDWSHPNRSGYYEKNKAFITHSSVPLADTLTEDPIQVMFNGSVAPMRELAATLKALPIADQFSVALTEYERRTAKRVEKIDFSKAPREVQFELPDWLLAKFDKAFGAETDKELAALCEGARLVRAEL